MRYLLATCPAEGRPPFLVLSTTQDLGVGPWMPAPCWNGCVDATTHPLVEVQPAELGSWLSRHVRPESVHSVSDHPDPPGRAPESGSGDLSAPQGGIPSGSPDRHRPLGARSGGAS